MIQRLHDQPMAVVAAFFCALFGPWTTWMQIFLVLVVLDYITGFLAGYVTRTLDSDIAKRGIFKKVGTIFAVALGHQLDLFTGTGDAWTKAVLSLLIISELWSNVENLDDIGVPLPAAMKEKIGQLRENNPRKRSRRNVKEKGGEQSNENQGQDC